MDSELNLKKMKKNTFQIDQSGKVEHSDQVTVVAVANGNVKTIKIGSTEKQKLIKVMRERDFPQKSYVLKIFAGLIFLLIKDENINRVQIDCEYPSYEGIIKNIILQLFRKFNLRAPDIEFVLIGKGAAAHRAGLDVFQKSKKANTVVKFEDIFELFYHKKMLEFPIKSR